MAKINRFEDLEVWQDAVRVGVKIYRLSESGNLKSDFSAKDQLKRSCLSISNNIAEGFEYNNNKTFQRFLTYAKGSAGEVRSELFFLKEVGIISDEMYNDLYPDLMKISKSISGFKKYLKEFESRKGSDQSSNL
jgi:four helix bundle protein